MIYTLFVLSSLSGVLSGVFMKLFRKSVSASGIGDGIYYAVNVPVALLYFGIMCGFNLKVDLITLIFSAVFSIVCYNAVFFQLGALGHTSLVNVSLFSSVGTLVASSLAGVLFFGDKISPKQLIGFLFTFIAVLMPYVTSKKERPSIMGLVFCILLALNGALVKIIMKLYYMVPDYLNENVFCFYTNVFLLPFVLFIQRRAFFKDRIISKMITSYKKPAIIASLAVICANISTLVSMIVVGKVDLFVSSVLAPPITLVVNFLFDLTIFKEKIKIVNIISVISAIIAVVFMI